MDELLIVLEGTDMMFAIRNLLRDFFNPSKQGIDRILRGAMPKKKTKRSRLRGSRRA